MGKILLNSLYYMHEHLKKCMKFMKEIQLVAKLKIVQLPRFTHKIGHSLYISLHYSEW